MRRISCFKPTSDDWYPCYKIANDQRHQGGFVEVALRTIDPEGKIYRVSIWGADDLGMDQDTSDPMEAQEWYNRVVNASIVSKKELLIWGFTYF